MPLPTKEDLKRYAANGAIGTIKWATPASFLVGCAAFFVNAILNAMSVKGKDEQTRVPAEVLLGLGIMFFVGGTANVIATWAKPEERGSSLLADGADDDVVTDIVTDIVTEADHMDNATCLRSEAVHNLARNLTPWPFLLGAVGVGGLDAYSLYSDHSSDKPLNIATLLNMVGAFCFFVGSIAFIVMNGAINAKKAAMNDDAEDRTEVLDRRIAIAEGVMAAAFFIGGPLFVVSDVLQNSDESAIRAKFGAAVSVSFTVGTTANLFTYLVGEKLVKALKRVASTPAAESDQPNHAVDANPLP